MFVDPTKAEISAPLKGVFYQHRGGFFGGIAMIIHALSDWDSGKNNEMNTSGWNLTPMGTNDHMFGASVGDRKYYEYYLEPNENLFLLGTAANSPDAPNNVLIRKGTNEPIFMISHKSEGQVVSSLRWQSIGLLLLGSILIIIGIIIPLYLSYGF